MGAAKPTFRRPLVDEVQRRHLLRGGLSLGALTMLTGCDVSDEDGVQRALHAVSRWNDRVQAALFSGTRLAPTYPESAIATVYRYNAYYAAEDAPEIGESTYRLELAGMIGDKRPWSIAQLHALPQVSQITRHVCVEGWSYVGKWTGTPLSVFLDRIGADRTAKYVGYECFDGYYGAIDMPTALHPQTIMAFSDRDGRLAPRYGYPFKIRMPTKLGFKNPKFVKVLYVTNRRPGGFWEDRGYNWFSGI